MMLWLDVWGVAVVPKGVLAAVALGLECPAFFLLISEDPQLRALAALEGSTGYLHPLLALISEKQVVVVCLDSVQPQETERCALGRLLVVGA